MAVSMEDGEAPTATQGDGSAMGTMMELLATPADDNSDSNGLDTDGYQLNGAFSFTVVRNAAPGQFSACARAMRGPVLTQHARATAACAGESRALLEPTVALTAVCPFNPPRPTPGTTPLETCITRRDVRSRGYPARTGAAEVPPLLLLHAPHYAVLTIGAAATSRPPWRLLRGTWLGRPLPQP